MAKRAFLFVLAAIATWLISPGDAFAHDVRGEVMFLDVGERVVRVELQVPLALLTLAREQSAEPDLVRYVESHLHAADRFAVPFAVKVESAIVQRVDDGDVMVAKAVLTAPPGGSARWFDLRDDVVLHRVTSDNVYVFLRRDPEAAVMEGEPELLGVMHYQQRSLVVDRSAGSRWRGFSLMFVTGLRHIAGGTDHLLFLFVLMLPASLLVERRRWAAPAAPGRSLRQTLKVVSAFTAGHTLSLAVAVLGLVSLPERPIEVLVALTIMISAVHAMRPIFAKREMFVAGGFGLVHGLAFATALQGIGLDGPTLAVGLLGFNLGVEAAQLVVVIATVPFLAVLSRRRHYPLVRNVCAVLALIAAGAWLAERAFGLHSRVPALVESIAARKPWLVVALAVSAALSIMQRTVARFRPLVGIEGGNEPSEALNRSGS